MFGVDAKHARLRDLSAFTDADLNWLMERLHKELIRRKASPLLVQSIAQAIAVHLARNYAELASEPHTGSPSLAGFKLRQITDWMAEHVAEEFNLERLAAHARLTKFHFDRLFKSATGMSPSQYHINLRMDAARRMLRETKKSIIAVAIDVGYSNPSHFAKVFRRETGPLAERLPSPALTREHRKSRGSSRQGQQRALREGILFRCFCPGRERWKFF